MTFNPPALGTLLEVLHRADAPFETVQATYRIWRHDERAAAAMRAEVEEEKRRGASISSYGMLGDSDAPVEHEEVLRLWRAGDRLREEYDGGAGDRSYGVRVGNLWWSWDQSYGATTNDGDPSFGSGIGERLSVMLDPTPLLGSLRFHALGRSQHAGRATITAEATPRPSGRHGLRSFELHRLGGGADLYTLEVDEKLGVLLDVVALRDGEAFHQITTVEITFDELIAAERFEFQPPAGEAVRPAGTHVRPEPIPVTEAQQRAPFTVLIPEHVPADWQLHCIFVEPSERPAMPAQVSPQYRSESGHENVQLSQFAARDRPDVYDELTKGDVWDEVVERGTVVHVIRPSARGHAQVQAHLELDGTFVFLTSETLGAEQLTRIAAALRPAPSTSGV